MLLTSLDASAQGIDVRLVIDVSGSMKSGDPQYLREDVLNHLVEMLPAGSRAGVWIFGSTANMIVPHGVIDEGWRRAARAARSHIGSTALRTNLDAALTTAAWDAADVSTGASSGVAADWDRHIVLVTDGRVDLADDPSINAAQRRSIETDLLPRLRAAHIRLDCLALSGDADLDFLKELAAATHGYAGRADTVAGVREYLARAIAGSAGPPKEQSEEGSFVVTEGSGEVTVLAEPSEDAFALITPAGERIDASARADGTRWHTADGVLLVTITSPASGSWRFSPASAHVRAWSRLGIDIRPNDAAEAPSLTLALTDAGAPIDEPHLSSLIVVEANLKTLYGTEALTVAQVDGAALTYSVSLGSMRLTADDEVTVRLVGKTFERTRTYTEAVAHPIDVDLRDAGDGNAAAMVRVNIADMDPTSLRVLGSTRNAGGRVKLVVGAKQADGAWLVAIPGLDKKVDIALKILFNSLDNKGIEVESDPISLDLPLLKNQRIGLGAAGHVVVDPIRPPPPVVEAQADIAPDLASAQLEQATAEAIVVADAAVDPVHPVDVGRTLAMWEWIAMGVIGFACAGLLVWRFLRTRSALPSRPLDAALDAYRAALTAAGAKPSGAVVA